MGRRARATPRGNRPAQRLGALAPAVTSRSTRPGLTASAMALLSVGTLLLVVGIAGLVWSRHAPTPQLVGPLVAGAPPAPDFALTDQSGRRTQLSAFRGRAVALTFLYTRCPDACPLIATKLSAAERQLGGEASRAVLLAVSVDPLHDTTAAVQNFDTEHQLLFSNWHYLLGSAAQLEPVWKAYFVQAGPASELASTPTAAGPSSSLVDHTALVYLIDPHQRIRVALDSSFLVSDVVQDIRALLGS